MSKKIEFLISLGNLIRTGGVKTIKQAMDFAKQQFGKVDQSFVDDIVNVFKKEGKTKEGDVVPIKKENLKRQLTEDEIDELSYEIGDVEAYPNFDGTVGSANKIRKEYKDYMDEMSEQYKAGKLDPDPGDKSRARLIFLENKVRRGDKITSEETKEIKELSELYANLDEAEGIMATDEAAEIVKKRTDDIATGDVTGETSDLMKGLEDRVTGIKKAADELKDISDPENIMDQIIKGQRARDPRQGVVRAAAREILNKNKVNIGREDPIDVLRKMYGEEGLEAVDAISDSLLDAQSYGEMNTILTQNKLFDLVPKKTYGYDESIVSAEKIRKAKEQEAKQRQILEEFDPTDRTKNADGGLINILKL